MVWWPGRAGPEDVQRECAENVLAQTKHAAAGSERIKGYSRASIGR